MLYNCKTVSLVQVPKGLKEPLCNSCLSRDCEHAIEKQSVALPSGKREWRVMSRGFDFTIVVSCVGYQSRKTPPENPYFAPEEQQNLPEKQDEET